MPPRALLRQTSSDCAWTSQTTRLRHLRPLRNRARTYQTPQRRIGEPSVIDWGANGEVLSDLVNSTQSLTLADKYQLTTGSGPTARPPFADTPNKILAFYPNPAVPCRDVASRRFGMSRSHLSHHFLAHVPHPTFQIAMQISHIPHQTGLVSTL